ncbi:hypothetical protein HMPREF0424_0540 [Gardnerella vaginalis 409-05]|uniref:hypothetical protein n=1 Tax=Gardnerella sp. KA01001 TaxID=2749081 RepID=UPI0001C218B4|nr:hypothetical protein HMPREF0424_0540 [Gardnerella vaginalis 409-05]
MRTLVKKTMGLLMATLVAFGVMAGTTQAFAAENNVPSEYVKGGKLITGTIDLSKTVNNVGKDVIKDGKLYYEGVASGVVEASDLFEGAYNKYIADIKGHTDGGNEWDHLVMFDKGQNFPTAKYTVTFSKNFKFNLDEITCSANTAMISGVEKSYNEDTNSVTFTFKLGNWNDYKEFFELYEKEKGTTGHPISVSIPYSVEIKDSSVKNLGDIKAEGKCELYKKFVFWEIKIVDITAKEIGFTVSR